MNLNEILRLRLLFQKAFFDWAVRTAMVEVRENYPLLRGYRKHGARAFFEAAQGLSKDDQEVLLVALVRRTHLDAMDEIGQTITALEHGFLERYDRTSERCLQDMMGTRRSGKLKPREVRQYIASQLKDRYRLSRDPSMPSSALSMEVQSGKLSVRTTVGGRLGALSYWHNVRTLTGENIAELVSCLSWFGLCGMTYWEVLTEEELPEVWTSIEQAIELFLRGTQEVSAEMPGV